MIRVLRCILCMCCLIGIGLPAAVASSGLPEAVISEVQTGTFNDRNLQYRVAYRAETILAPDGEPAVTIYAADYRLEVAAEAPRPVIFIWNGGPSVASTTLHMAGFGPQRLVVPEFDGKPPKEPFQLMENPHTLLDLADLVFIDPPETGWSRHLHERYLPWLYSVEGDAWVVARFIEQWLSRHAHAQSSIYLMGTSYGSIRAAVVSRMLAEAGRPAAGAIVFSQGVNLIENTQRRLNLIGYASNISQMAAIAWFHQRGVHSQRSLETVVAEAEAFAMTDYLHALTQGHALPAAELSRVSQQLADFLGLPAERIEEHHLLINKGMFRRWLLEDTRHILTANDARYTFTEDVPGSSNPPVIGVPAVWEQAFQDLFGVPLDFDHYRLRAPETDAWDWGGSSALDGERASLGDPRSVFADYDWTGDLALASAAHPDFKLFIGVGIYDTLTTYGPARLLATSPILSPERIALRYYPGGHAFYAHTAIFESLCADLRDFLFENKVSSDEGR